MIKRTRVGLVGLALLAFMWGFFSGPANAIAPSPGHSWDQVECNTVLCVTPQGIGVGTTSPTQKLTVIGSEFLVSAPSAGGTVPLLHFSNPNTLKDWVFKHADSKFHIQTGVASGTEKVTIQDNGFVGIGTTAPTARLEIAGSNANVQIDGQVNDCALPTYVGSTAKFNGNQGGYAGVNAKCNTVVSGSHVCSGDELTRSLRCGYSVPTNQWFNTYTYADTYIGTTKTFLMDCNKWGDSTASYAGSVWPALSDACSQTHEFMCCK